MSETPFARLRGARIAQLIESDGPGGAERAVVYLATAFQSAGCPTVVFVPAGGEGWLEQQLAGTGVAIEHVRSEPSPSPATVAALRAAFRRHRISLVHSHEFGMAVYGAAAARLAGARHVLTLHGGNYYAERRRRLAALRGAVALSHAVIAVSRRFADQLARRLGVESARITLVPNGVRHEPPPAVTIRRELGLGPDERLILAVGNLYPVKGHRYLIEALRMIADQQPHAQGAIAGRGAEAGPLAALACRLGIAHRVHLLGLRSDVPNLLAGADVFVQPSLSEGLPLSLLEAMFAGRPIVASDVGEIAVALAHGEAGVLVPPGNATALAQALGRLLSDPDLAQGLVRRAVCRANQEYGVDRMVTRHAELYAHVLRR